ncbi:hypothetical protein [Salinigranum marinum]|uniref:hypothetical protein n=1 Tax=Salinigranum marinum TaxID=1515595 RepID=UPI00298A05E4|nr:hypothetical protein [Salinigranum marinum]
MGQDPPISPPKTKEASQPYGYLNAASESSTGGNFGGNLQWTPPQPTRTDEVVITWTTDLVVTRLRVYDELGNKVEDFNGTDYFVEDSPLTLSYDSTLTSKTRVDYSDQGTDASIDYDVHRQGLNPHDHPI